METAEQELKYHTQVNKIQLTEPRRNANQSDGIITSGHYVLFEDALVAVERHSAELQKRLEEQTQKAERLVKTATEIGHLHNCEQEGIGSGQPTPAQWFQAVDDLEAALAEYNNK